MPRAVLKWLGGQAGLLWSSRFHVGDEESQGFTHRDELGRCYGLDNQETVQACTSSPDSGDGLQLGSSDRRSPAGPYPKITTWEAGWNVTNAIQGIFVLGLPYALLQSGYLGFLLLVLAAVICSYTGKILIACLYEEDEDGRPVRVRDSYEDIANACCRHLCPKFGGKVVNLAQVVELLMTCILYLVVSSSLMCHSFTFITLSPSAWTLVTFLSLVPCMLIRDLRMVSRLSLLCSLAQFLITFIIIVFCLQQAHRWSWRKMVLWVDFEKFLVSIGVIIFSYTSQIFLPTLEGSMEDRCDFSDMMTWTHALACIFKTIFAVLAFLTWGEDTKEVITDNLPTGLRLVVNLCLLAKALLSYPLPFYAATEVLQTSFLKLRPSGTTPERGTLVLRGSLLLLTFLMATYVPHFSLLMGLTGSVTGAAMTFLLPSLFHLQLKWSTLSSRMKALDVLILVLGSLCSLSGVICSIKGTIEAFGN
ncbi:vesicular inhibitory amino acid transporter [Denticeps clupeoides]|uniref:Vesicular inhibitory amino acid transporter n=1 Tax=Denticeps clupeoides TaxID=299321 RepID=A0AAY4D6Z0_9TELE|nr:vesicular inhibitory amino acid transporter-like [Denticeps clupeoides]